jgi:hypothetical protein
MNDKQFESKRKQSLQNYSLSTETSIYPTINNFNEDYEHHEQQHLYYNDNQPLVQQRPFYYPQNFEQKKVIIYEKRNGGICKKLCFFSFCFLCVLFSLCCCLSCVGVFGGGFYVVKT